MYRGEPDQTVWRAGCKETGWCWRTGKVKENYDVLGSHCMKVGENVVTLMLDTRLIT